MDAMVTTILVELRKGRHRALRRLPLLHCAQIWGFRKAFCSDASAPAREAPA